jgi:hypothetical protein
MKQSVTKSALSPVVEISSALSASSTVISSDEVWAHEDVRKFLKLDSIDQIKELTRKRTKRPLPCHRVGKYVRFKKSEVVRWFDEGLKAA